MYAQLCTIAAAWAISSLCLSASFSFMLKCHEMSMLYPFERWHVDHFLIISRSHVSVSRCIFPKPPPVLTTRPRKRKRPSVAGTQRQLGGTTSTALVTRLGPPPIAGKSVEYQWNVNGIPISPWEPDPKFLICDKTRAKTRSSQSFHESL